MGREYAGMCLLLLACNDPVVAAEPTGTTAEETCPTSLVLEGSGEVCLSDEGLWGNLVEAGGCASILGAGCSAVLDGDRIVVESWAEVDPGCPATQGACVLSLSGVFADCGLPSLSDGTWTLVYGSDEVTLEWPLTEVACAGEAPPQY